MCRWAGAEDLNARLLVLAGGWGGGDDAPDLLACATDAPLHKVSGGAAPAILEAAALDVTLAAAPDMPPLSLRTDL